MKLKQHIDQQYSHVKTIPLTPDTSAPNTSVGDTVTVNRNLHNGQTTEIKVKAIAQQNQEIIIAGNQVQ